MARWNSGESRLPAAAPADTLVARYLRRAHSGFCTCPLAVTNTAIISEAFLADLFSFLLMPFRGPFSRVSKLSSQSTKMNPNFRETLAVRRLPSLQPSPATSFSLIVLSVSFYFSETRCRLYQHRSLKLVQKSGRCSAQSSVAAPKTQKIQADTALTSRYAETKIKSRSRRASHRCRARRSGPHRT